MWVPLGNRSYLLDVEQARFHTGGETMLTGDIRQTAKLAALAPGRLGVRTLTIPDSTPVILV